MPLPGTVRYNQLNPSGSQRFLHEDNPSSCRIICPNCGTYEQKSCQDGPTQVLSLTLIYSMSHQQAGKLSGQKGTFVRWLGLGQTPLGLTLTLALKDSPLPYCVLVYLYPVDPHPYSNVLPTQVRPCGFPRPNPASLLLQVATKASLRPGPA